MKEQFIRLLSVLLTTAMLLAWLPVQPARAATKGCLEYTIENGEVTITDCDPEAEYELVIPDRIEGYPVTAIGDKAFNSCKHLSRVTIPEGVTSIGKFAFSGCNLLSTVTLPKSIISIGDSAFSFCKNLSTIELPEGLVSIGERVFDFSGLTFVTIPASVTQIHYTAFSECSKLSSITVSEDNAVYSSDASNALYNKDKTLLIRVPQTIRPSYTVPAGVVTIGKGAFYGCLTLYTVDLPKGLVSIQGDAFSGCEHLHDVVLPETVTTIEAHAFRNCEHLNPNVYNGGKYLESEQNSYFALLDTYYTYPHDFAVHSQTKVIADGALASSCVTSVTIGDTVTHIGKGVFDDCEDLEGIWVHQDNPAYCSDACGVLYNKEQTTLVKAPVTLANGYVIPESVICIDNRGFDGCILIQEITIPNSVISIGERAFGSCWNLETVTLSNSLKSIGNEAFYGCWLKAITIPGSVTHLGSRAFLECTCLKTIYFCGNAPVFTDEAFGSIVELIVATVYYPANNPTWTADVMQDYGGDITWVPYEVEQTGISISGSAKGFGDCTGLTVQLWQEGAEAASYTAILDGDTYSFEDVAPGSYILKISMENGVTRTYPVEAGTTSVSQDIAISPLGDVNGDAKVNVGDVARIYAHVRSTGKIADDYALTCSDVNGDGRINIGDAARTYSHARGTNPLW